MTRIDRARIERIARRYDDNDPIIQDARYWLLDAFGHDEDAEEYIETMSTFEVVLAVERHFGGGWEHFVETSLPAR